MSAKALLDTNGVIQLSGELKFPVIVQLRSQLEYILRSASGVVQIDFSAVSDSDSSAVSLWLCCLRYAKSVGVEIEPINIPEDMMAFARLVGLDKHLV